MAPDLLRTPGAPVRGPGPSALGTAGIVAPASEVGGAASH